MRLRLPTPILRARGPLGLAEALLPIGVMLASFLAGSLWLESSEDLLIAALLVAAAVATGVAARHGHAWEEVQRATGEKLAGALPAILILLAVGLLIGSWVLGGTIPFLVYWGVRLVSPEHLVLTSFVATASMSLCTGTSWGSAGTIGVALMGTALAVGAPLDATAGAVVSGAYLGDKMSPVSDTTNVAALAASADLYRHVRHMVYTAAPSCAVALAVYSLFAGGVPPPGAAVESGRLLGELARDFALGPVVLLPLVVAVLGMLRGLPALGAIALSSAAALALALSVQGFALADAIRTAVRGFDVSMLASRGVEWQQASPRLVALVTRGGLSSMVPTLLVVIAAFLLAGALDVSGALRLVLGRVLAVGRGTFGLVAATMASGAALISVTSHASVTALVVGELYQPAYRARGLAPENLSRSIEDSVTIVEPLLPWTVSAVYMATTLGVPTVRYAPWALFCLTGPVFSLLYAAAWPWTRFGLAPLESPLAEGAP